MTPNRLLSLDCRVSTSLCRLLLKGQKASDALLLMTILSTDLRSLKRRGYNGEYLRVSSGLCADGRWHVVDRILKRQKAEQLAVLEAAKAQTENNALMSQGAAQPKHQSRPDSTPEKATGLTNESLQDNAGNVGAPSKPMWSSSVIKSLNRVMQNHSPSGNGFPSFAPRMSRQRSAQGVTPLSSICKLLLTQQPRLVSCSVIKRKTSSKPSKRVPRRTRNFYGTESKCRL